MEESNLNLHLDAHHVPGYVVSGGLLNLNSGPSYRTAPGSVLANSLVSGLHHQTLTGNLFDQQAASTITLTDHFHHPDHTFPPKLVFPVGSFVVLVLAFGLVWYVRQIYRLLVRDRPEPEPERKRLLPNVTGVSERDLEQGVPEVPEQRETVD